MLIDRRGRWARLLSSVALLFVVVALGGWSDGGNGFQPPIAAKRAQGKPKPVIRTARAPVVRVGTVAGVTGGARAGKASGVEASGKSKGGIAGPDFAFSTGGTQNTRADLGGSPADSNVASSDTNICLTVNGAFACYTKGGALVSPGKGFGAQPFNAADFFEKNGVLIDGDARAGRVVFDHVRKRFFMEFVTTETPSRLLMMVSKTQNPEDGWFLYTWNVGDGAGYDKIGIDTKHFLVSLERDVNGVCCEWVNFFFPAAALASGAPHFQARLWQSSVGFRACPVISDTKTTDSFWAHRTADDQIRVWGLRNGALVAKDFDVRDSGGPFDATAKGTTNPAVDGIDFSRLIGRSFQNAERRGPVINLVSNDAVTPQGMSDPRDVERLVALNVGNYFQSGGGSVVADEFLGVRDAGESSSAVFDYGWPAVSTNSRGDTVVGELRVNPTTFTEQRAIILFGDGSPNQSRAIINSASLLPNTGMAGAASDPNTNAIYLSQQFGVKSAGLNPPLTFRVRVAKILGRLFPDVIATKVKVPTPLHIGDHATAKVTIRNQGDKPMPVFKGDLRLSTNATVSASDPLLTVFSVPSLGVNETKTVKVGFDVVDRINPRKYFVGAGVNTEGVIQAEYSSANNRNPYLAGNHGNVPVTIKP